MHKLEPEKLMQELKTFQGGVVDTSTLNNTLMILMALLIQRQISLEEYQNAYSSLHEIARYSPAVWQVGQQFFSLYS